MTRFFSRRVVWAALAAILVLLLGAELYCRRNHPDPEPKDDPEKHLKTHWMAPYTMYTRFPYPSPEIPPDRENEIRVVVTGGSTVERSVPSIPELLQKEFEKNGAGNVRVFNYGVEGQKSSQELIHLVMNVADLKPDLIVMYNGASDIIQPVAAEPRPGYPYNFYEFENNPVLLPATSYPLLTLVAYGSNLARHRFYDFFANRLGDYAGVKELREKVGYGSPEWREQIADIYVDNLRKADRISRAFGADFVAMLQPLVYYKDPLHSDENQVIPHNFVPESHPDYFELVRSHALATRDLIRTKIGPASSSGLHFIDLSDAFDGVQERVFETYMYLTPSANERIASRIFDPIRGLVRDASKERAVRAK